MQTQETYTEGDILDLLADTVKRVKVYGPAEARNVFCRQMTDRMRIAFDLFLVRTKDPLAHQPGTCENRFFERVMRMAFPPAQEGTVTR